MQGWKMQDWKMKDHIDEKRNAEDKIGLANAFERRVIINFVHIVNATQPFATNKCMQLCESCTKIKIKPYKLIKAPLVRNTGAPQ